MRLLLPAAVAAVIISACSTTGCLDNQSAIPLAEFCSSSTGAAIVLSNVVIRGVGAPGDSAIFASSASASKVYLPMRSTKESTSWSIHYAQPGIDDPANNDTVTFRYESEPYFASSECGAMYNYRITQVSYTTHLIDSVIIVDSLITNIDRTYIRFYFRTAETPGEEADEQ